MKKIIVAMAFVAFGASQAKADGFVCEATDDNLTVKVYNHVLPEEGTRTAAVMVVSDPTVSAGRKTIATFKRSEANLYSRGTRYIAFVDGDEIRTGELIAGTKLGYIERLVLDVGFSYSAPGGRRHDRPRPFDDYKDQRSAHLPQFRVRALSAQLTRFCSGANGGRRCGRRFA